MWMFQQQQQLQKMTQRKSSFLKRQKQSRKPSWISNRLEHSRLKRLERCRDLEDDERFLLLIEKERSMRFCQESREIQAKLDSVKKREAAFQGECIHVLNMINKKLLKGSVDRLLIGFINNVCIKKQKAIDVMLGWKAIA